MLTKETLLTCKNQTGAMVVFDASCAIEFLADEVHTQANEADGTTETAKPCTIIRALALRIKALNSVIMSATSEDDITVYSAYDTLYGPGAPAAFAREAGDNARADAEALEDRYMRGVRLAVEIFTAGAALPGGQQDACELAARIRGKKNPVQNNFAFAFVQALIESPEVAEGFAAVLSNIAAVKGQVEASELEKLTYAQIVGKQATPRSAPAEAIAARAQILETI